MVQANLFGVCLFFMDLFWSFVVRTGRITLGSALGGLTYTLELLFKLRSGFAHTLSFPLLNLAVRP